ncbi:MAG: nucleotide exchange factor GrpE [Alphaproteobacteria bacterium]|nr:nucleotide exchange factor GrpE [Alphaproteobacteria bacterium]
MMEDSNKKVLESEEEGILSPDETPQVNWEEEALTFKDQWLRAVADAENIRKRAIKERDDALKYSVTKLAHDIVSVADNIKRALATCPDVIPTEVEALIHGIKLIEDELKATLDRHGIKEVSPLGDVFDPNFHQAMFEVPLTEGLVPGTIAEVLQVGYIIHDRLLRPALVGVIKT